jgi:hypothetical protein
VPERAIRGESPHQVGAVLFLVVLGGVRRLDRRQQRARLQQQEPRADRQELGQHVRLDARHRPHLRKVLVRHGDQAQLRDREAASLDQVK